MQWLLPKERLTMINNEQIIRDFIVLAINEARVREADISGGGRSSWGSDEHISDLTKRIEELSAWRDKYKKGSETRANYSRLISKLKAELRSASRNKVKDQS